MCSEREKCLLILEQAHAQLAAQVRPPQKVWVGCGYTYRYSEKSLEQALIQLLARTITGLRASDLLLKSGFLQEQEILHRTLHEIEENIFFLAIGKIREQLGDIHEQFLQNFYQEPALSPLAQQKVTKLKRVSRPVIRDWIAATEAPNSGTLASTTAVRQLYEIGSGYVHASSAQIMDSCVGDPPRWQLRGNFHKQLHADHDENLWNYFYRAILTFVFSAAAIGDRSLEDSLRYFAQDFAASAGKNCAAPG
ncbi:hypothetical protein [Hyphomicrobium sp.]|uniref:hypothetical protein n=1 Tax=Hyphomicrobium sp. TaxID=82 RepID=UPI002BCCE66C|nr:hypothetical protein [Hyphomicrobium sp.]HRN87522.1 hypothetical protein [Hyphomicrobium sp.]HRQ28247.1 hypothetical protein [Hyphomicrobium sp.]